MLVGRDAECAVLRRATTAGPVVVLIAGEAGAGKTTLAEHVLAQSPARVLRGRAAEWAGTAYDALARALRPAVAARQPRTRERPPAREQPLAGEHGILAQVMPELGTPPPVPDAGALAAAVCSVLGSGPAVLFLDDLQWADDATLSLLPPLADAASGREIALVGCYRSDELPRGHRLRTVRGAMGVLGAAVARVGAWAAAERGPVPSPG
jgi:hypothetical protein